MYRYYNSRGQVALFARNLRSDVFESPSFTTEAEAREWADLHEFNVSRLELRFVH